MRLRPRLTTLVPAKADEPELPVHRSRSLSAGCRHLTRRLAVTLVGAVAAVPVYAGNSVPDWVRTAAAQTLGSIPQSAKAVVLLEDETYTVASDGKATLHVREVIKILRPQGRDDALPVVWYDKDSKILSMHVWSIDPAGHQYALKDTEIIDIGEPGEGGELYSDARARAAAPPGRDPGGVIAFEYERRERPYVAEANWFFQGELPRLNQSFTLVLPPGYTYKASWAHHAPVTGATLADSTVRWQMDRQDGIDLDDVPLSPAPRSLAGRMTLHYAGPGVAESQEGTWQGIGEWYDKLSRDRLVASPEIAAKAAELTAGKTDFYDKAQAIGQFVQKQIRYFVVEMGVGGYQPHPADEIFRGRYGDCKDKATLLSAMLSSVGIHSALLMVDTQRGVIDPDDPSLIGNHMIAAIQIPQGYGSPLLHSVVTAKSGRRYLIFDPTWERTPFGQLESNLQGSYGVLMEGDASQVIQLPVLSPDLNRVERLGTFQLAADGSLKGSVIEKRYGDLAERRREIFSKDQTAQQQFLDRSVADDFMSASLSGLRVENAEALNQDLTLTYQLDAAHFGSLTGPLLMIRPRVFGSEAIPVDRKWRKIAINLGETMEAHDSFSIDLPEGYTADELPDPVKVDFGFASYESSTELQGHTLHYTRTFVLKQVTLPPDKYPQIQKLAGLIAADEQNRAVLKRTN